MAKSTPDTQATPSSPSPGPASHTSHQAPPGESTALPGPRAEGAGPPSRRKLDTADSPPPAKRRCRECRRSSSPQEDTISCPVDAPHSELACQLDLTCRPSRWSGVDSWYQFPSELREMICEYALPTLHARDLYEPFNKKIQAYHERRLAGAPAEAFPTFDGKLSTPTILLLCRDITDMCLRIQEPKTFVFDRLPPWLPGRLTPMNVMQFVGRRTLQALPAIDIRLAVGEGRLGSGWAWADSVLTMLDVLAERNAFIELRVMIRSHCAPQDSVWMEEAEMLQVLSDKVNLLRHYSPNVFSPGFIMMDPWIMDGLVARRMDRVSVPVLPGAPELGEMMVWKESGETRNYPDPELWPGSLTEAL